MHYFLLQYSFRLLYLLRFCVSSSLIFMHIHSIYLSKNYQFGRLFLQNIFIYIQTFYLQYTKRMTIDNTKNNTKKK